MSGTPEFNKISKFSPYGKPINKAHLTPCRQIGLSRKRKTPSSLTKTPLNSSVLNINNSSSSPVTPLNHKTPVAKTESKVVFDDSPVNQDTKKSKSVREKTIKKCLNNNFKNSIKEKNSSSQEKVLTPVNNLENEPIEKQYVKEKVIGKKQSLRDVKVVLQNLSSEDIENHQIHIKNEAESDIQYRDSSSEEESEEIIKVKKRKMMVLSDDEDELEGFDNNLTNKLSGNHTNTDENLSGENKEINNVINEENGEVFGKDIEAKKKTKETDKNENISSVCQVETTKTAVSRQIFAIEDNSDIEKLSGSTISSKTDDEFKVFLLNEDDDFMDTSKKKSKLKLIRKESSDKDAKSLKRTKSKEKKLKTIKSTQSSLSLLDEEEDAFTSTPEREKSEKLALMEKLKKLEGEVKKKRKMLEDLKQAQIYKSKHNVEELKTLTEVWRNGCVRGLNELLVKLQCHGPMNMTALLNNLQISNDIATRCLKLDLNEEKVEKEVKSDGSEDFYVSPNSESS